MMLTMTLINDLINEGVNVETQQINSINDTEYIVADSDSGVVEYVSQLSMMITVEKTK